MKIFSASLRICDRIEFIEYCNQLIDAPVSKKGKGDNRVFYYDIPCSFDIETSSFYDNGNKKATMYVWQLGINGVVTMGRTWKDFLELLEELHVIFNTDDKHVLVIYIHNLSYEFQFMRRLLEWDKVFAIKSRTPIYAKTAYGIEFRCSYLLSGYSLETLGKNLVRYKIEKLVGNLDYSLVRHSSTNLSDDEIMYCVNDVRVVMAYIQEKLDNGETLATIPYTKTGYVRTYTRKYCLNDNKRKKSCYDYRKLMRSLTLEPDEYMMLKRAFQGGFTHANYNKVDIVHTNVSSADFTSSYPAVMLMEKFPMSKGKLTKITSLKQYKEMKKNHCVIFDVEFTNISAKVGYENILSNSKCTRIEGGVLNNGRVMFADLVVTTITDVDFDSMTHFYTWDNIRIGKAYVYQKAYLPTSLICAMLKLYSDKTTLKGVEGKEVEYLNGKEQLNSTYGMIVTDIVRDEITYDDEWDRKKANIEEAIKTYNDDNRRFLFYPWGVYVTAYARRNLYTGILELKDDYIYSDTDSVKFTNIEKHKIYFDNYNEAVRKKIIEAMKHHKLPLELSEPKTKKGVKKLIGVWDMDDGFYYRFKTLGAKRYMVEDDYGINITVSGVNKKTAVPYLLEQFTDPFENFSDGLMIPSVYEKNGKKINATGKMTMTYIDEEIAGLVEDYKGSKNMYHESSCIHAENSSYYLSLTPIYNELLNTRTLL